MLLCIVGQCWINQGDFMFKVGIEILINDYVVYGDDVVGNVFVGYDIGVFEQCIDLFVFNFGEQVMGVVGLQYMFKLDDIELGQVWVVYFVFFIEN